jgi:hypothetical protein
MRYGDDKNQIALNRVQNSVGKSTGKTASHILLDEPKTFRGREHLLDCSLDFPGEGSSPSPTCRAS